MAHAPLGHVADAFMDWRVSPSGAKRPQQQGSLFHRSILAASSISGQTPRSLLFPHFCPRSSRRSDTVSFLPLLSLYLSLLMTFRSQRACTVTHRTTLCCHSCRHHPLVLVVRPPPHPRTFHHDLKRGGRNRISVSSFRAAS